jgi:hypothetical protein
MLVEAPSGSVSEKLARPARAISQGTHVIAPTRRSRSEESLPHNPAMLIPSTRLCGAHHRLANSLWRRAYSTQKTSPPLRILFAGSDEFSAVSLRALHKEQQENPELIASLDVLCREDGKTGRKRNILKEGMTLTIPLFFLSPQCQLRSPGIPRNSKLPSQSPDIPQPPICIPPS